MRENRWEGGNITTARELRDYLHLTPDDEAKMEAILEHYPMSIPSYYLSLINFDDPNDPIKKMCIPSIQETDLSGAFDTSGEAENTVIEGMQHKYKQTAMILSTNHCAMYCRHCFRKRLVGLSDGEVLKHLDEMRDYISQHKEITNVLVSGGDSFMNSNATLRRYLETLTSIEHLTFIRFGTRVPVVLPQRITQDEELQEILRSFALKKQIHIVTQFNHPNELTKEATDAVKCLTRLGIPVRNQSVLLRGVNDVPEVLASLLNGLVANGVAPYYLFQCRPVTGVKSQFQVPLEEGLQIVEETKKQLSGFGKAFRYAMSHVTGKVEILGKTSGGEMVFKYHQAKDLEDCGRLFTVKLREGQCWLDD